MEPSTHDRARLDEALFAPAPPVHDLDSFVGYTFPVEGGCQVYGGSTENEEVDVVAHLPVDPLVDLVPESPLESSPETLPEPLPELASELTPEPTPEPVPPIPSLAVVGDLLAVWGETVLLGPDILQLSGPLPVLIDLLVLTAPRQGTLLRDGFALSAGDLFTQEDVDCGRIAYRHDGDQGGVDSFTFTTPAGEIPVVEIHILLPEPPAPSESIVESPAEPALSETTSEVVEETTVATTEEAVVIADASPPRFTPPAAEEQPAPAQVATPEPVLLPFAPVTLPQLPPPWRVSFRVEAVCGTGLAVVRCDGAGVWQYSRDEGETWHDIGRVYHGRARLLLPTDRLRFVPYRGATGRVSLGARAWRGETLAAEFACLGSTQALTRSEVFGPQLLNLRWTLDR